MRKLQILGAMVAVVAFSAFAVVGASATLWTKHGSTTTLTVSEPAQAHGSLILVHTILTITTKIECKGLFDGTIGPGVSDLVSLVLGEKGEEDLITCTVLQGGTGACTAGKLVTVHPLNLPWKTELKLEGELTWDYFLEDGKGLPGYDVLCGTELQIDCTGNLRIHFDKNLANGALFLWLGRESLESKCTDGGNATIETGKTGSIELLGVDVV